MYGKTEFGLDYICIMRSIQLQGHEGQLDVVDDAAARLFLLHWGLTAKEIDEVNELFDNMLEARTLPDEMTAIKRLVERIKGDKESVERLVAEVAAVAQMDLTVTDAEAAVVGWFRDFLDLKASEFRMLFERGRDWALALNYFGREYAKKRPAG